MKAFWWTYSIASCGVIILIVEAIRSGTPYIWLVWVFVVLFLLSMILAWKGQKALKRINSSSG